jgi:hypothetical protein
LCDDVEVEAILAHGGCARRHIKTANDSDVMQRGVGTSICVMLRVDRQTELQVNLTICRELAISLTKTRTENK